MAASFPESGKSARAQSPSFTGGVSVLINNVGVALYGSRAEKVALAGEDNGRSWEMRRSSLQLLSFGRACRA